jgi:hypothetical protein
VAALTYPSQLAGMLGAPEPMLLDTCVIQNIEWVWDRMEEPDGGQWTEQRVAALEARFGADLAEDLLCLGDLVDHFQYEGGFPWLVSSSTRAEIERFTGPGEKPIRILQGWTRLSEAKDDWAPDSFGSTAPGFLDAAHQVRPNPLILRGLGVASVEEIVADSGPLSAFPHQGDRALIRDALLSGVPAILTTDLRSFWANRETLYDLGLEVWRPSDVLTAYEPQWAAEQEMFARRRAEHDARRRQETAATSLRPDPPQAARSTGST